jgi:hypothetical protein
LRRRIVTTARRLIGSLNVIAHRHVDPRPRAAAENHPQTNYGGDQHQKEDSGADEAFSLSTWSSLFGVCFVIPFVIKGSVRGDERILCLAGLAFRDAGGAVVAPVVISGWIHLDLLT